MENLFAHIPGNDYVKQRLLTCLKKGAYHHPFCFQGIGHDKTLFAKAFAGAIAEASCDIIELQPVGKVALHSVEAVRTFCEEAYIAPFSGNNKVLIIHEAERMLPSSANALLKTLEEPGPHVIIILLTSHAESLLPTIRSRVRTIYFESAKETYTPDILELFTKRINYIDLKRFLSTLDSKYEERKKELEETALERLLAPYKDTEISAKQKGEIEKLSQGSASVEILQEGKNTLQAVLHFFRDLHVIYHGGSESLLVHPHLASKMFDIATAKEPLPLERIEEGVQDAISAFERSTPLSSCIENLFLKLNFV